MERSNIENEMEKKAAARAAAETDDAAKIVEKEKEK